MALMVWSEHFVTGIDVIDAQHKGLVDLINAAAPQLAMIGEAPARGVRPLLDRLAQYAAQHFKDEEAVMSAGGMDGAALVKHQKIHGVFAQEVTQMISDAMADNNVSGAFLLRFLTSWLTFHILAEDQCMARQLKAIQTGTPADLAAAQTGSCIETSDNSANAVLVSALTDLFSLVTQRNVELKQLNAALMLSKQQLEESHAQLEVRVSDRTLALKQANEQLEKDRAMLAASLDQVRQVQAQLLHSEKMAGIGQLAAGVAHEINNPIGFVSSNFSSLSAYIKRLFSLVDAYEKSENGLPADHSMRLHLCHARELAELDYLRQDIPALLRESSEGLSRVKRIVSDLMAFSSQAGGGEWQSADINSCLESTLNVVWSEIKDKAIVSKDFGALPPVRCIPAELNQVFMNLLVNAAQAIESAGVITLCTQADGNSVQIKVSDTGCGIPPDVQKRIFEPFFTTKPVGKGTGLGLSLAWDIIKRHHGQIEVQSNQGAGTTFTITLPIVPPIALTGSGVT